MFNDFLITDINQNTDFCYQILTAIRSSQSERFSGNVYELKIEQNQAVLSNLHDENIAPEFIGLTLLHDALKKHSEINGL
jgi:hypothetical protein